ncbi:MULTISPECIES: DNA polymerase III subunit chi [Sphingobium]|uniref:DNA polymerase III subunit chi n=1 Tax=Sphingobium fuliginis ATCC 27551 TaxID=1208342 RepID=A0A5B8CCR4_SPHSA|nr:MULTISPECIES: DNA polymerase III subunit chi [Sphingobium]OAP30996.1 DNA polymerase III subunit chi [Sphingobium sp. 20006FA]KXU31796.1 DNA polymerase III subunit chi [Sphingobium sp. AM]KYC29716.1 DNA polymerase III subunit chi [Sphingobium sp. 22B]QDC36016.1 DNA polymerase III subunit chi [Sphingobium fuliginis ATCC 27551]UXC91086.1 DNA polymerase III subunit chi [Sphingobium sp. RSMS]
MQVDFYQLSRDPVEQVLPAIAGRILEMGERLLVVAREPERLERISAGLWAGPPESFLAHGRAGDGGESVQPVLLAQDCPSVDLAANGARHVALADGLWREEALGFERAFYFFDAETVEGARASWRDLAKRDGVTPRFWRQEGRKWVQGP